eukprot:scaffold6.g2810.t1
MPAATCSTSARCQQAISLGTGAPRARASAARPEGVTRPVGLGMARRAILCQSNRDVKARVAAPVKEDAVIEHEAVEPPSFAGMSYNEQYDVLYQEQPLRLKQLVPKPDRAAQAQEPGATKVLLSDVYAVPRTNQWVNRQWSTKDKLYAGFLGGMHVLALGALFTISWENFWMFMAGYFVTGALGITLSYHRHLTHRAFETPKWLEYILAYCGAMAVQGDPIEWVSCHRYHHIHCDTPLDPHSPFEGFWWSHAGWLLDDKATQERIYDNTNAKDMTKDPFYRHLAKYYPLHIAGQLVALFALGGWDCLIWAGALRMCWVWHVTWFVNSAAHVWGSQDYNTGDLSRNNWWVGILAFGEGWHNNHHAFESSARHGLEWWQHDNMALCAPQPVSNRTNNDTSSLLGHLMQILGGGPARHLPPAVPPVALTQGLATAVSRKRQPPRQTTRALLGDRSGAAAPAGLQLQQEPEQAALSYVRGRTDVPLLDLTLGQALEQAAARFGEPTSQRPHDSAPPASRSELLAEANAVARALLALGVLRGDRVAMWAPTVAEWVILQFAVAQAGAVLVNINPAYRSSGKPSLECLPQSIAQLASALGHCGVSVLVMVGSHKGGSFEEMVAQLEAEGRLPALRHKVVLGEGPSRPGSMSWEELRQAGEGAGLAEALDRRKAELGCEEPANIQFTSGTTGERAATGRRPCHPKATMLSHRNLVNNGLFIGQTCRYSEVDRICLPVPCFHCFSLTIGTMAAVAHGSTLVYPSATFSPEAALRAVEREACTSLYGVPAMFIQELEHPRQATNPGGQPGPPAGRRRLLPPTACHQTPSNRASAMPQLASFFPRCLSSRSFFLPIFLPLSSFKKYRLDSLRTGVMAGSPCPVEVMRRAQRDMHMREVTICYGMTETAPVSFQSSCDDPVERRVTTVGRIHPHLEAKVVDPATGAVVPRGTVGELCVRGYSVMVGYYGDDVATAAAIDADGYMHTGDLASIDAEGYCNICGRQKDVVIMSGENIYPREVEEFLHRHPDVAEVNVFGVPDRKRGEVLCAWVKLREGSEGVGVQQLRDFCMGQISGFKIPRHWKLVKEFPMTLSGKPMKFKMREAAIHELGLEAAAEVQTAVRGAELSSASKGLGTPRASSTLQAGCSQLQEPTARARLVVRLQASKRGSGEEEGRVSPAEQAKSAGEQGSPAVRGAKKAAGAGERPMPAAGRPGAMQEGQVSYHHDLHEMTNVDTEPMMSDPGDLGRVAEGVIEEAEDIDEHGNPKHPPQA